LEHAPLAAEAAVCRDGTALMSGRLVSSGPGKPIAIGLAMLFAAIAAWYLTPRPVDDRASPSLSEVVPATFGDWRELKNAAAPVDPRTQEADERSMRSPYDDVLMRAYGNSHGDIVLLALAYGRNQQQEVKIHRPELCYTSQGFDVLNRSTADISLSDSRRSEVRGARMLVRSPDRVEAISYWIRIGDIYSENAWTTRYYIFKEGLKGRRVDGMLVRVSQIFRDPQSASMNRYRLQEQFLAELIGAMPASARHLVVAATAGRQVSG
jgi:EpsI family protein